MLFAALGEAEKLRRLRPVFSRECLCVLLLGCFVDGKFFYLVCWLNFGIREVGTVKLIGRSKRICGFKDWRGWAWLSHGLLRITWVVCLCLSLFRGREWVVGLGGERSDGVRLKLISCF